MKKMFAFLCLIIMFMLVPNVYAKEKVSIESVSIESKSDTVSEKSKPLINGLSVNFDLSFSNLNDNIKYKIVVNNPTNKDFEINKNNKFNISDYVNYRYEFSNNSNIVKAKSKLTMYMIITYNKEVPSNKLVNNKYVENNKMMISLSNDNTNNITNPKTGVNIICIVGLIVIVFGSVLLIKLTKTKKYLSIIIIGLILLPLGVFAIDKLQIIVNTKITIERKYKVIYHFSSILTDDEVSQYYSAIRPSELNSNLPDYSYIINDKKYTLYYITVVDFYAPGDRVDARSFEYREGRCNGNYETVPGTNSKICYDGTFNNMNAGLSYSWSYQEQADNEIVNMNFTGPGFYEESHSLSIDNQMYTLAIFRVPKQFTMLSHDVDLNLFTATL